MISEENHINVILIKEREFHNIIFSFSLDIRQLKLI